MARAGHGKAKGSAYEREICVFLSLWWTANHREDIFWRSSASGGRATVRGKKGLSTAHQGGDVACTDPEGAPLTDLFAIEIKRGYSYSSIHELLDRHPKMALPEFGRWITQAIRSSEMTGTYSWLLITRRDRKMPIIWMTGDVAMEFSKRCGFKPSTCLTCGFYDGDEYRSVLGARFSDFLSMVDRRTIEAMAGEL